MKRAFSLIELSIVVLVIGILIAGVTQSTRLLSQARLNTARSITQSSPVAGINGLILWLEPTLEESFNESETEDEAQLTDWNDVNPQTVSKYFNIVASGSSAITYETNGINNIPTVEFSGATGSNAYFSLSTSSSSVVDTPIQTTNNAFTSFVVVELDSSVDSSDTLQRFVFYNGSSSLNGFGISRQGPATNTGKRRILFGSVVGILSSSTMSASVPEIISTTYTGGSGGTIEMYSSTSSSALTLSTTTATMVTPLTQFAVGNSKSSAGTFPWKGFISEIIIFDRKLKTEERTAIEEYLSKKYAIKLAS